MRSFGIDLPVANILHNPRHDWKSLKRGRMRVAQHEISVDWNKFNLNDFLFTHCSIVSSVELEDNGYYIKPPCDELVNSNGNAWSNPVLLATFRSFIGADNFYEHVQLPEMSKGKVLDAVIRPVVYEGKNGGTANVHYVDILVATHRKHDNLVSRIEAGKLNTLSMGCVAHVLTCSRCGFESNDDNDQCEHIRDQLMTYFVDPKGVKRIVSELCGRTYRDPVTGEWKGDPSSVSFVEASWVENPAFKGAVVNYFVSEVAASKAASFADSDKLIDLWGEDISKLRVADAMGMISLRVACAELRRRRFGQMVNRVARTL